MDDGLHQRLKMLCLCKVFHLHLQESSLQVMNLLRHHCSLLYSFKRFCEVVSLDCVCIEHHLPSLVAAYVKDVGVDSGPNQKVVCWTSWGLEIVDVLKYEAKGSM